MTTRPLAEQVSAWVAEAWSPDLTVREWWQRLADAGYSNPMLPPPYGLGVGQDEAVTVGRELARAGVLGPPGGLGLMLAAPTIAVHGTDEQKERFLPSILNGEAGWCQLFSEPGAGSDLAGIRTRAQRDGDEWVVDGQKVWTSTGQHADWGILMARTDPDLPKHKGISYFLFPMRQDGVDVRPLREMTGRSLFNEVFITAARVGDDCLLGGLNNGWAVANTTLMFERSGIGGGGTSFSAAIPGTVAGHLDRKVSEFLGERGSLGALEMGPGFVRHLIEVAREQGRLTDPLIRQDLASLYTRVELIRLGIARAKSGSGQTGAEGNLAKLAMSDALRAGRSLVGALLGPAATLWGPESATGGALQEMIVFSPAPSIFGGTDQIQKNIIGERVLRLPKEPGPAKDTPFRDLPTGDR
ncbi:acyl-CoA dehydrogenase family protein [Acidiferrimicrobium sp. IK]|uniref:acyl-CoA dehydrogenase family protein n=1 Tax=Acidiferrimicrobium sp. IK TaxID=2871700 RepID=UPI0021CB8F65|nr:acyl-CoA dehydrogenase family protein [Acidiferrimicrobium sp. IK]MCU4187466.1 acyl-CoA dehydrogenase family protein [Acidiferrimicrobium sp. IK]